MKCDYDGLKRGSVVCRQPAIWNVVFAEMRGNVQWRTVRINYCRTHEFTTRGKIPSSRGAGGGAVVYKRIGRVRLKTVEDPR